MTALAIHPLTPDRWDDFVALFETDSICKMCWCVHHRLPAEVRRETDPKSRKAAMAKIVKKGPPPGLLAYKGDEAVGWLAIARVPQRPTGMSAARRRLPNCPSMAKTKASGPRAASSSARMRVGWA